LQVHDIEDLAKIGKRHTACPYFVARHLADTADLVFCPYSYLLDPNIRRSTRVREAGWLGSECLAGEQQTWSLQLHQGFGRSMAECKHTQC
jgi:Rad3-related DNA helicase